MKKFLPLILLLLFSISLVSAQTVQKSTNPVGKWKFEAPSAPEEYNSGSIEISFAGNKYSTAISITGSDYVIPGQKTRIENDTITFIVMLEEEEVVVSLKQENNIKMTGKAVYSEGEIPLTLTKEK